MIVSALIWFGSGSFGCFISGPNSKPSRCFSQVARFCSPWSSVLVFARFLIAQRKASASNSSDPPLLQLRASVRKNRDKMEIGGKDSVSEKHLEDCTVANALGTWFFSVAGALIAIPVGIRKKSLGPLVFFGTTGTMLDIIIGISQCEREFAERHIKLMEEKNPSNASVKVPEVDS